MTHPNPPEVVTQGEGPVEVLPCPFCGAPGKMIHPMGEWSTAYAREGHAGGYGPDGSRIVCSADDCCGCGRVCYGPNQDAEAIGAWNTRHRLRHTPDREAMARAIREADASFSYSFNMTRLVDGIATHTLIMPGFDPVDFEDRDDGYRLIEERRSQVRADAIIAMIEGSGAL